MKDTIDQHHINCSSMTFNDLNLQNGALTKQSKTISDMNSSNLLRTEQKRTKKVTCTTSLYVSFSTIVFWDHCTSSKSRSGIPSPLFFIKNRLHHKSYSTHSKSQTYNKVHKYICTVPDGTCRYNTEGLPHFFVFIVQLSIKSLLLKLCNNLKLPKKKK